MLVSIVEGTVLGIGVGVSQVERTGNEIDEGLETPRSVNTLTGMGVEYLQGFFFGKLLTVQEYTIWARSNRARTRSAAPAIRKATVE
jgi:hypothetical protein